MWGLYVLSGELGESQALLTRWYIACGHVGVPEVVVFVIVAKYTSRTSVLSVLILCFRAS